MTCQDSFHEVAFNISFWTRNISSARILFWRGVYFQLLEFMSYSLFEIFGNHFDHASLVSFTTNILQSRFRVKNNVL